MGGGAGRFTDPSLSSAERNASRRDRLRASAAAAAGATYPLEVGRAGSVRWIELHAALLVGRRKVTDRTLARRTDEGKGLHQPRRADSVLPRERRRRQDRDSRTAGPRASCRGGDLGHMGERRRDAHLHRARRVARAPQEGEAGRGDLLRRVRRRRRGDGSPGHLRVQRRPRSGLGLPAHGSGRADTRRSPARRLAPGDACPARHERVLLALLHRPRLRRPGRHGLQPGDREREARGDEETKEKGPDAFDPKEFFGTKRDLESLCEFMGRWLSARGRWGSPMVIAGESYGGYRVGRLARMLQESAGIGLSGAILISPALEITSLDPSDYDVVGWIDTLPTMAAAALHHGRSRAFRTGPRSRSCSPRPRRSRRASSRRSSRKAQRCPRPIATASSPGRPT